MLAMHQDIQDRIVSELNEAYQSATSPSTTESISKLDYMEKVIKETMRLLPVGPFLGRQCLADTKISMYGWQVSINNPLISQNFSGKALARYRLDR